MLLRKYTAMTYHVIMTTMMMCFMTARATASVSQSLMMANHIKRTLHSYYAKQSHGYKRHLSSAFCYNANRNRSGHTHHRAYLGCYTSNHHFLNNVGVGTVPVKPMHLLSIPHINERYLSYTPTVAMYSSKSDTDESPTKIDDSTNLSEIIAQAFSIGETDGVQDAILSHNILTRLASEFSADEAADQLIEAAIEAAGQNNRGTLAAILNAILASCSGSNDEDPLSVSSVASSCGHPHMALAILDMMDEMHAADDSSMVTPDIVTLSLVYYALTTTTQSSSGEEFESESQVLLERAQKSAKKMAGSRRRKELVAERRRRGGSEIDISEVQSMMQSLYGPDICILHDTDDVIVMSKPAGMVCYHSKKTSAGKITSSRKKKSREASKSGKQDGHNIDISLVDALGQSFSLSTLNPIARGIVHRLDRGTSGTIILAKNDDMHMRLVALFFLRRVKKKYLALAPACAIACGEGSAVADSEPVQLSVGSTGVMDTPVGGRPAQSTYKVVAEYGEQGSSSPEALLLEVETLTGRKHQVRVHSASLGHPIFLDPLYHPSSSLTKLKVAETRRKKKKNKPNTKEKNAEVVELPALPKAVADLLEESNMNQQQERFFLHAASLSIPEMDISVDAPLPGWWTETVDKMQQK